MRTDVQLPALITRQLPENNSDADRSVIGEIGEDVLTHHPRQRTLGPRREKPAAVPIHEKARRIVPIFLSQPMQIPAILPPPDVRYIRVQRRARAINALQYLGPFSLDGRQPVGGGDLVHQDDL